MPTKWKPGTKVEGYCKPMNKLGTIVRENLPGSPGSYIIRGEDSTCFNAQESHITLPGGKFPFLESLGKVSTKVVAVEKRECAIPGCSKDISTSSKDFGGYVVKEGLTLCKEHWDTWIEMRNFHNREEESFLRGKE